MKTANGTLHLDKRRAVSNIGMVVILVSFAMLFAALLLGYVVFRLTNEVWPPMGMQTVPLTLPFVSTVIIGVSSLMYMNFEKSFNAKDVNNSKKYFFLTLLLGLAFMGVQFLLWGQMADIGLYVSAGVFPSLLYALTWVHAGHIVVALLALLLLVPAVFKDYSDEKIIWVQNIGKFWHFLGIIWFIMFVVMFVF
ncbi:MAG: cytochrome c oxidase subunit 3 [Bdellovibrionota bacterium]|nr:cytochrome c oxidase subunit 3 [Bdellovibrionota bacterium]